MEALLNDLISCSGSVLSYDVHVYSALHFNGVQLPAQIFLHATLHMHACIHKSLCNGIKAAHAIKDSLI